MHRPGFLALLLLLSCNEDLPKATEITHMRVLGVRMEVMGEPERSTPAPGETARLTFATAYPTLEDDDAQLQSLFIACTAPDRYTGIPICQEFIDAAMKEGMSVPDALASQDVQRVSCEPGIDAAIPSGTLLIACKTGTPALDVAVEAKSKVEAKLVRGVICQNGVPYVDPADPQLFGCTRNKGVKAADAEQLAIYALVPIEHEAADANRNPSFADATLSLHGMEEWPVFTAVPAETDAGVEGARATDDDCAAAAAMELVPASDGLDETLRIEWDEGAREKVDGARETLELSAYATAGELDRRFTVFGPDAPVSGGRLRGELVWKMTKEERAALGKGSKLVRFYFSVLDRRGGFDATTRALCVHRQP